MAEENKTEGAPETPQNDPEQTQAPAAKPDAKPAAKNTAKSAEKPATKAATRRKPKERVEVFEATRPDGKKVKVTRNIETGKSSASVVE